MFVRVLNISFYIICVSIISSLGYMSVCRHVGDYHFNVGRKLTHLYATTHERDPNFGTIKATMQYHYWKAVEWNWLEFYHYARRLNSEYRKALTKK